MTATPTVRPTVTPTPTVRPTAAPTPGVTPSPTASPSRPAGAGTPKTVKARRAAFAKRTGRLTLRRQAGVTYTVKIKGGGKKARTVKVTPKSKKVTRITLAKRQKAVVTVRAAKGYHLKGTKRWVFKR